MVEVGDTVVRRDVFHGQVWTAWPHRVVRTGPELALACWPGVEGQTSTTYREWMRSGDDAARKLGPPNLAAGSWELAPLAWTGTTVILSVRPGRWYSVNHFQGPGRHFWYVNFERPITRGPFGIDTFDLMLDLVVAPDLSSHTWKDEDEYRQGRRLGLVTDDEHRHVEAARGEALDLLERRAGPFAVDWSDWQPDPAWPRPALPAHVLTVD